jgi:protein TonB
MGPWDPAPPEPEALTPEPKRRGSRARGLLLVVALIVIVALLALYVVGASFTLREVTYEDESVDLEIIEPIPPPAAQPAVPPPPESSIGPNGEVVRHPAWVKVPEPIFPRLAMRRGVEQGVVVLRCETLATGQLGACEALSETPPGAGFAEAALAATRQARIRPYSIDGFETDSSVTFTVRFRVAPES